MSDDQPILTERRGERQGILWITLNRPEKLNALTFPLLRQLQQICIDTRADRSVRCVVITGAGRGFCAGMDHSGAADPDTEPPPADAPIAVYDVRIEGDDIMVGPKG